ncbi:MAG: hypothetical protein DCC68_12400 [Planctomycetota bacterium]|nr:MAG: hypothetical protein DCC68_12400 [Planctomycetota bacterium]
MSEIGSTIDPVLLDRLVDGELDARTQAELLARLDERPGQWRRLALTFVEAQTLGVELRSAVADARHSPVRAAPVDAQGHVAARSANAPWTKLLSLAATMLIAVGIGFGAGRVWHAYDAQPADTTKPPNPAAIAANEPSDPWSDPFIPAVPASLDALSPEGLMTVQAADGSPVQLPVYEVSQGTGQLLNSLESSVPPEVIRALRSRGHDVKQQRRLWPIDLGDGRQIIVPVDQVDVEYVGHRAYQ